VNQFLKSIGGFALVVVGLVAVSVVVFLLVQGGAWLADKVYPWLIMVFAVAFWVCVFILLPLAIFRKTRGFSGIGIYVASYVFGITLWVWCLLTTYTLWGGFAVVIGILIAGIGIVPLAIIASLTKGLWSIAIQMVVVALVTLGARFAAFALVKSADEHRQVRR
jgi:hypothetical protein